MGVDHRRIRARASHNVPIGGEDKETGHVDSILHALCRGQSQLKPPRMLNLRTTYRITSLKYEAPRRHVESASSTMKPLANIWGRGRAPIKSMAGANTGPRTRRGGGGCAVMVVLHQRQRESVSEREKGEKSQIRHSAYGSAGLGGHRRDWFWEDVRQKGKKESESPKERV